MYENNLFIKDSVIFDTEYECIKKYRCKNETWIFYVLEFTYIVIIDRFINGAGHGIRKIDGINRSDNTCKKKCMIGTK